MKLDIGSFMFNADLEGGAGNPSWGTALGQGEGYRFNENSQGLMVSLVYNAVLDKSKIDIRLGKGGAGIANGQFKIVIGSLYEKVYFNGTLINGAKYLLAITIENTLHHTGRRSLKYTPSMTYDGKNYNEDCIAKIRNQMGWSNKQAFVIYEITSNSQDDLQLHGVVLERNIFVTPNERKDYIIDVINRKSDVKVPTTKDIGNYIKSKGFSYSGNLVENFYLSLKSKPFVILAGISGTGKTRLVKLFAEAIGATAGNGRYNLIPVRPDWSDSSDLFGHLDLNGNFIEGPVTKVVKRANDDLEHPYFICLDEMNLARVEYYLSDFLSVVESRKKEDGGIVAEVPLFTIPQHKEVDEEGNIVDVEEATIKLTDNIYIVGTVNMDETTFPFSKKVLDRANTIEFSEVILDAKIDITKEQAVLANVPNDFLKAEYVTLMDCGTTDKTEIDVWVKKLVSINEALKPIDMHVGYRVRDELIFYMLYNKKIDLMEENKAFNNQVMQKILPRIQGSNEGIRGALIGIFNACDFDRTKKVIVDQDDELMFNEMKSVAGEESPLANKIMAMIKRLSRDGYTKFWI